MKYIKKVLFIIIFILMFLQLGSKYSYGVSSWGYTIKDIVGKRVVFMDDYEYPLSSDGWTACCRHMGKYGYSDTIAVAYESYYDSNSKTISVRCANYSGVYNGTANLPEIKRFATALSLSGFIKRCKKCNKRSCNK